MIRLLRILSILILLVGAGVAGGLYAKRPVEAWLFLSDVAAGGGPSLYRSWSDAPVRMPVAYRIGERARTGDLYQPAAEARAALLLVPGVAPRGKDDPRLIALAETLARARFRVLVPEMAGFRALSVAPEDAREIADGVAYLAGDSSERPVGIAAISYAVGPALIAALEPDVKERVDFIVGIGGFHDLGRVITFFTTGYYRMGEGAWQHREPNAYGKWVFVLSNAQRLSDPRDRARFNEMARRRLADPESPIDDLARGLTPEGEAFFALLSNRAPERVPELLGALPGAILDELERLNPARHALEDLTARLILVHGRDDPIIPESESAALAQALGPERARLYLVDSLAHVDFLESASFTLWRAALRLLEERDGVGAP